MDPVPGRIGWTRVNDADLRMSALRSMAIFEVLPWGQSGNPLERTMEEYGIVVSALAVDVLQRFILFSEQ